LHDCMSSVNISGCCNFPSVGLNFLEPHLPDITLERLSL
jgi:hypothetical protein